MIKIKTTFVTVRGWLSLYKLTTEEKLDNVIKLEVLEAEE